MLLPGAPWSSYLVFYPVAWTELAMSCKEEEGAAQLEASSALSVGPNTAPGALCPLAMGICTLTPSRSYLETLKTEDPYSLELRARVLIFVTFWKPMCCQSSAR